MVEAMCQQVSPEEFLELDRVLDEVERLHQARQNLNALLCMNAT